jgi:hypothetical protein
MELSRIILTGTDFMWFLCLFLQLKKTSEVTDKLPTLEFGTEWMETLCNVSEGWEGVRMDGGGEGETGMCPLQWIVVVG